MREIKNITITPEILKLIADIDEFKGRCKAMQTLPPERLTSLKRVRVDDPVHLLMVNGRGTPNHYAEWPHGCCGGRGSGMGTKDKARWQLGGILCGISFTGIGPEGSQAQGTASEDQFVTFLLDTHGVSEWVKPRPNPGLIGWTESTDEDRVFISVITLSELRYGVERMAAGKRQNRLEAWLRHELPMRFEGRILPIDSNIAETWGKMVSSSEAAGRPMGAMDAFLAATAENHRLTLVTRNISDFLLLKAVLNPWT